MIALLLLAAVAARAGYEPPNPAYAPPASYYNGATGTGTTLHTNLHTIISANYHGISYGDARYALAITDQDPNNSSNILLVYNRASVPGTWDVGVTWNREHLWPQSKLGVSVSNTYIGPASDLFELKPCNPSINSSRSNDAYGTPTSTGGYVNNSSYFFPGDADKGDVARSMFYMATRYYDGSGTPSIQNLSLVNGYSIATYQMGDLQSFLHWNYTDGVDNFERRRNQMIYNDTVTPSYSQNNRNPFIDHPEYVWAVFGDSPNDAQISVAPPDASGASMASANLGRIMKNAAFGTSTVSVTKTGVDPTTFDLTTSGNAATIASGSALIAGTGQPMDYGPQTRAIVAGLNGSTATTGLQTGTITIHDTDLTSAGPGKGSADGDDVINVSGAVLDNRVVTGTNVDLGAVHLGGAQSGNTMLSTTGDDNHFTRVTVAGRLFNSASSTGSATIGPSLGTAGSTAGTVTLVTTGEGLSGEMPVNVAVHYTAQMFTGKMAWNPAVTSGNWATDGNWTDTQSSATAGAPGLAGSLSAGDTATFSNAAAATTVDLASASPHVAAISFAGANPFTIAQGTGNGTLHLDNGTSLATITAATGGHQIAAPLALDSTTSIEVTRAADTLSIAGPLTVASSVAKAGSGMLQFTGATHLAASSTINVTAGAMQLNAAPGSTVGAGIVASISSGATLDLAGSTSALSPAGLAGNARPSIKNDGTLALTVAGTAQVVGAIDNGPRATGATSVAAGTSLTADHIVQQALFIGGADSSPALVTIAASDDSGNPLFVPLPFGVATDASYADTAATTESQDELFGIVGVASIANPTGDSNAMRGAAVPEPASILLMTISAALAESWRRRSMRSARRRSQPLEVLPQFGD